MSGYTICPKCGETLWHDGITVHVCPVGYAAASADPEPIALRAEVSRLRAELAAARASKPQIPASAIFDGSEVEWLEDGKRYANYYPPQLGASMQRIPVHVVRADAVEVVAAPEENLRRDD